MGLLEVHSQGLSEAFNRQLVNPGPPPQPASFNLWSFLGAGGKAPVSGALESAGSLADVLSGFGTIGAAGGDSAEGMFSTGTAAEKKQAAEARDRMLAGDVFDTSVGNTLRRRADEWAPDPETATKADQVIHGLVSGVSKAVTDTALLGGVPGAIVFGLEEGNTAAQRLRMKGIDTETAAKVGAVTGVASALGAGVPLAGQTVAKTIGLGIAAGPGTFIPQEALTREILQRAGHADEASLHDPLDPLGLALSVGIPGVMGGLHIRALAKRTETLPGLPLAQLTTAELGKLKYNDPRLDAYAEQAATAHGVPPAVLLGIKNAGEKSNSDQTSPAGAKGVMQFMPATAKEMGLADPANPVASIDAGAAYLRKLYDAYGSWDAAVAHYNGGGAQAVLVRGGGKPTIPETAAYLDRVKAYAAEHSAAKGAADPVVVDAARVKTTDDALMRSMPDHPDARAEVLKASDEVAAGRVPEVAPVRPEVPTAEPSEALRVAQESNTFTGQASGAGRLVGMTQPKGTPLDKLFANFADNSGDAANLPQFRAAMLERANAEPAQFAKDPVASTEQPFAGDKTVQIEAAKSGNTRVQVKAADGTVIAAARIKGGMLDSIAVHESAKGQGLGENLLRFLDQNRIANIHEVPDRSPGFVRIQKAALSERQPVTSARPEPVTNPLPHPDSPTIAEPPLPKPAAGKPEAPSLDTQRVTQLAADSPGLRVKLPGSDETMTVGDALTRAKEEAASEASEADLVRAAVNCALGL